MNKSTHLAIEIFELLLSGTERDKKHAANLADRLSMDELAGLKLTADELAVLAEKAYFSKGRKRRPWKL